MGDDEGPVVIRVCFMCDDAIKGEAFVLDVEGTDVLICKACDEDDA